jgi:chromosome segregation ATPase
MGLNQFLHEVSCELQEILWHDVPRQPAGEPSRLEADLRLATAQLMQLRSAVQELGNGLDEKARQIRRLQARVEVYLHVADKLNAWRYALELDQLRKRRDQERARLRRQQHAYEIQYTHVRHIQKQLDMYPFAM